LHLLNCRFVDWNDADIDVVVVVDVDGDYDYEYYYYNDDCGLNVVVVDDDNCLE